MKDFFSSKKFKMLVAIFAVVLGIMIAAVYNEGSATVVSNMVGFVAKPFQKLSSEISSSVGSWFQKFTDYEALYNENQRLQQEVRDMREQLIDYNTIKHENEQYSKIVDVLEKQKDWKLQPASIIVRDPQDRFFSFTIDKGSMDGIEYLDPVMSADGLVGFVSEVGATYAKVITILDVKVSVGVYDSTTRDIGVLSGSVDLAGEGCSAVEYPREGEIKPGDMILTSGSLTGGVSMFPRDIFIGTVVEVAPDEHGTNQRAVIKLATDIAKVKDVFVITEFEGQGKS